MGSRMSYNSYCNVNSKELYKHRQGWWCVLAGGCEVQVFKMYIGNIKTSSITEKLFKIISNLYKRQFYIVFYSFIQ
jgi:hypothetical protein